MSKKYSYINYKMLPTLSPGSAVDIGMNSFVCKKTKYARFQSYYTRIYYGGKHILQKPAVHRLYVSLNGIKPIAHNSSSR